MKVACSFVLSVIFLLFAALCSAEVFKDASEARLSNGLKIIMLENHKSPIISFQVWYRAGARNEKTGKTGLAHMLEHMMFKGTGKVSGEQFVKTIYELGGEQNASTSHDFAAFFETLASDSMGVPIDFESDRMSNLVLRESDFRTERMVVLEERRMRVDDNPQSFLLEQLEAAAYQSQPYHWPVIGWAEDIERLTIEDVKAFYSTYYNPANAFVVVTGDFKKEALLPEMEKAFGKIPAGTSPQQYFIQDPPQPGERRVIVERPAQVGNLVVAWHVPNLRSQDSYILEVIKAILAEGKTSRLYDHLVRGKALVLESSVDYNLATLDPSLFYIVVTFLPGKDFGEIEQAIYDELELLKKTPVSARELEKAKNQLEADFVFDQESIFSLGQNLAEYEIALDWASIGAYVPSIRSVTPEEIQRVASKYFTAQNRNIGILTPTGPPVKLPFRAGPEPAGGGMKGRSIRLRASDVGNEVIP
ncbi:MAG: M16 family metallopeptidase [Syntrophobacteraceae bacterium]